MVGMSRQDMTIIPTANRVGLPTSKTSVGVHDFYGVYLGRRKLLLPMQLPCMSLIHRCHHRILEVSGLQWQGRNGCRICDSL